MADYIGGWVSGGCQADPPLHTTDFTPTLPAASSLEWRMCNAVYCSAVLGGYTGPPVPSRPFPVRGSRGTNWGHRGSKGEAKSFPNLFLFPTFWYSYIDSSLSSWGVWHCEGFEIIAELKMTLSMALFQVKSKVNRTARGTELGSRETCN